MLIYGRFLPFSLILTFLSLSLRVEIAECTTFPFLRRQYGAKAYIIPITCNGSLPDGSYGTIRTGSGDSKYHSGLFSHLEELCSAYSQAEAHFEGYCIAYNEAHVDSPATLVWGLSLAETSGLFDDRIFASCRANCRCPSPRDSLLSFKLAKARKMYEARQRERVEPDLNVLEPDMSDYDGLLFPGEQRGKETVRGQCGVACNGEYKCAGQRDRPNLVRGKCVCKAVPVAKKSWAVLGCAAQASKGFARLGGRRRAIEVEEEHFCPCNATYVSAGCCGSDGLVWERPEERMGSLWTIDQAEDDSLP